MLHQFRGIGQIYPRLRANAIPNAPASMINAPDRFPTEKKVQDGRACRFVVRPVLDDKEGTAYHRA
jgi:hypothetical protein